MSEPSPTSPLERCIELLTSRIEAEGRRVDLLELRVVPLLERIAVALEASGHAVPGAGDDGRSSATARFREALQRGDWDEAEAILADLAPEHPSAPRLSEQLVRARDAATVDLRGRLDAARQVNDPEAAIGLRDQLIPLLAPGPLRELDQELVKWLMGLIQRRLRGGTIRPDVVQLAATVSEKFGGSGEGASLKAALPTLRRSAGLCPRCGEPYVGEEDTCPKCRAEAAARLGPPDEGPTFEDDLDVPEVGPLDLNNERNWESA